MPNQIGIVAALFRYPVKSMLGEQVAELEITERGAIGDRDIVISLDADHASLPKYGKHAIGVGAESSDVPEAVDSFRTADARVGKGRLERRIVAVDASEECDPSSPQKFLHVIPVS